MAILVLNLVGVEAYVPNTDGKALLAVLPNATGLGRSPAGSHDGNRQARHLPILWEDVASTSPASIGSPAIFPGARLSFQLQGTIPALDLTVIAQAAQQGWLTVDPALLSQTPDSRVSGQILINAGTVTQFQQMQPGYCAMTWSSASFGQSLTPVVGGLTVTIPGVTSVNAIASRWVSTNPAVPAVPLSIYQRDLSGLQDTDQVQLYLGNICAEDVLDWPRNSFSVGNLARNKDSDFKWVYGLAQASDLATWTDAGLPVPVVRGGGIDEDMAPTQAFAATWGGGGGAGCECNGLLHQASAFAY